MNREGWGLLLIGGAVLIWAVQYFQERQAIANGTLAEGQGLTWTDRAFSPAGIALVTGLVLAGPPLYKRVV